MVQAAAVEQAFMTGNEVAARAALAAGAQFLFGYPITPQNEIMHHWKRLAPEHGRGFLQTEDELSAGFAVLGAVFAGTAAFSATAGPGTILFQEPLSMAEMMGLPMVLVVQQRGGPSTATVIYSQQELTLSCLGGNGEGLRIVYSTSGHQELYDYTIKAFHAAWRWRFPAIVLGDGYQAKMSEAVEVYSPRALGFGKIPARPILGGDLSSGGGPAFTHLRNAFSVEEELAEELDRSLERYAGAERELVEYEFFGEPGGRLLVVAHGIVARAALWAVRELREEGHRVNFFRPVTVRPFPEKALRESFRASGGAILVAESAFGQLGRFVKEALAGETVAALRTLYRPGVGITTEEIREAVLA